MSIPEIKDEGSRLQISIALVVQYRGLTNLSGTWSSSGSGTASRDSSSWRAVGPTRHTVGMPGVLLWPWMIPSLWMSLIL